MTTIQRQRQTPFMTPTKWALLLGLIGIGATAIRATRSGRHVPEQRLVEATLRTIAVPVRNRRPRRIRSTQRQCNGCEILPAPTNTPDDVCAICLETFGSTEGEGIQTIRTPCGHRFCQECLDEYIDLNGDHCPLCRARLVE